MSDKVLYRNITISGLPGVGSSTLAKLLRDRLGWEYFSGGDFMRAYAVEHGLFDPKKTTHHDATVYSEDFDRKVDYGMRDSLENKDHKIYDAWLSGFLAQGIDGVFKILVVCSDDAVRVDRLANRDGISIADAKVHIFDREKKNLDKWSRMYEKEWNDWVVGRGVLSKDDDIYFWKPELYDMVIDTFRLSKEEVLDVVLREILG